VRALVYDAFRSPPELRCVPDPEPGPGGVVLRVEATGLCRSDWHGWMGHDPDIIVPHVPGHEIAGVVEETGSGVVRFRPGDRVTLPFVCGCGACGECLSGNAQVCDRQFQPGFTHWGSFAERVAVAYADANLVRLPDGLGFAAAASLGCRLATAYRAVVDRGRVRPGDWVAVHGCGGVGASAVLIAAAAGARVLAVDIDPEKLAFARELGAEATVDARSEPDVAGCVREATGGGAHVSLDALGSAAVCRAAVSGLRKRGRHVQVGLLPPDERDAAVPMSSVIARELEIVGSHGMPAARYPELLDRIVHGELDPGRLIGRTIGLGEAGAALVAMGGVAGPGITVIEPGRTAE